MVVNSFVVTPPWSVAPPAFQGGILSFLVRSLKGSGIGSLTGQPHRLTRWVNGLLGSQRRETTELSDP